MENVISSIMGWRQVWILLYYRVMFLLALCEGTSDQLSQLINLLVSTFPLFLLFSLFTCYSHQDIIIALVIIFGQGSYTSFQPKNKNEYSLTLVCRVCSLQKSHPKSALDDPHMQKVRYIINRILKLPDHQRFVSNQDQEILLGLLTNLFP